MKCFRVLAIAVCVLVRTLPTWADGIDDQYIRIFSLIQEADALADHEQSVQALAKYMEALTSLQRFQKGYPEFNADVVTFRLNYTSSKIEALSHRSDVANPAIKTPEKGPSPEKRTPESENQIPRLNEQIRLLVGEKSLLEAKLKEALAAQPAAIDPRELTKAEASLKAAQKENELLKASLTSEKAKSAPVLDTNVLQRAQQALVLANTELAEQKELVRKLTLEKNAIEERLKKSSVEGESVVKNQQTIAELNRQLKEEKDVAARLELEKEALQTRLKPQTETESLAALRTKLAALEAQAVPYTAEELALMKDAPAKLDAGSSTNTTKAARGPLPPAVAKLISEARRDFAAKELEKAEQKYQKASKEDSGNPMILTDLALIQMERKRFDEAEMSLKEALAAAPPEHAYVYSTIGRLKFLQEKYNDAVDALSRAAQLDDKSAEIQNRLGIALNQKGMRTAAEAALRKALQLEPGYAEAHQNLALVYASQKPPMIELARWHYQKAVAAGAQKNPEIERMLEQRKIAAQ